MKRLYKEIRIAVVVVLSLSLFLLPSCGKKKKVETDIKLPVMGVVIQTVGEYDVFPLDSNCWIAGGPGMPLFNGDRVWVEPDSNISVVTPEGARFRVNPNSSLVLSSLGEAESGITLFRGGLDMFADSADEQLTVTSPAVTVIPDKSSAGENSFAISVDPAGTSTVEIFEGSATLETETETARGKSSQRYDVSVGEPPRLDETAETAGAPEENNSSFVKMLIPNYYPDEGKREEVLEKAVDLVESGSQETWPYTTVAQVLIDRRELDEAAGVLVAVLAIDPHEGMALLARGNIELLQGRWNEARDTFVNARRSDKRTIGPPLGIAHACMGMGDLPAAEKWYKEVLNIEPEEPSALTGLAVVKILESDFNEAALDLRKVLTFDKDDFAANRAMAVIELLGGNGSKALDYMNAAVASEPKSFETWTSIGVLQIKLGDPAGADAAFRRLIGSENGLYMSYGYQGQGAIDWRNGGVEKAFEKWAKALDLEKGRSPLDVDLGMAFQSEGMQEPARLQYSNLLSADPQDFYGYRLTAEVSMNMAMYDEAITECSLALGYNNLDWPSRLILGMSFFKSGNTDTGGSQMKQARKTMFEWEPAAGELFLAGYSYELSENFESALELYRKAQKLFPNEGYYYYRAGMALLGLSEEEEAEDEFRKALEAGHPYAPAAVEIARFKADEGDIEGATREIESAVKLDEDNVELRIKVVEYLREQEYYDAAIDHLAEAREIEGLDAATASELAVIEGNLRDETRDYPQAIELYREALALNPGRGDAWYFMAVDLEKTGKAPDAMEAYRQAHALCAANPQWQEYAQKAAEKLGQNPG